MSLVLRWITALSLLTCWALISCANMTVTVVDFSLQTTVPEISLGTEFPGAQATGLLIADDGNATGKTVAARLQYDFTKGGTYTQFTTSPAVPELVTRIRYMVRGSGQPKVLVRICDAKGEIFQMSLPYTGAGEWQELLTPVSPAMDGWEHWGGDGKLDEPIRTVAVGAAKQELQGTIDLRTISVDTALSQDALHDAIIHNITLAFHTPAEGNVFRADEAVSGTLSIPQPPPALVSLAVTPVVRDVYGNTVATLPLVRLTQENRYAATIAALPSSIGQYALGFTYGDAQVSSSSYAILPLNPIIDRDVQSPFGVCTHFDQGVNTRWATIAKRAGIAWIRDGGERGVETAKENKLCLMACFAWGRPDEQYRKANGGCTVPLYSRFAKFGVSNNH